MDLEMEDELAADLVKHERVGATAHDVGLVAPGYIRATHPDHGEPVTFIPGELLPQWAAKALTAGLGRFQADSGVFVLDGRPTRSRTGRKAA